MSRQTHVLSFPESGSAAAKKTKYAWVAVATLVAALILGAFASIPRVSASSVGTSNLLPYTDVTWFYSEHTGAQTDAAATLADNPELVYAQAYVPVTGSESAGASLADNPELVYAESYVGTSSSTVSVSQASGPVADTCRAPETRLYDNPELAYSEHFGGC